MRRLALLALLIGCYEPEARDCTVECDAADECADGQVCGADGFCAVPELAGTCDPNGNNADAQTVSLIVTITGKGKVVVDSTGTCDSDTSEGTCMFAVSPGVMRQLAAVEIKDDREFVSWTATCTGSSSTCSVTPVSLTHVGAKFE